MEHNEENTDRPDGDDLPHKTWECDMCHGINSDTDAECVWCEGEGF